MIHSDEMYQAMDLIADMPPGDPDKVVFNQLVEIEKKIPESEKEFFSDLWEGYAVQM